jgi:hypothetical protein
MLLNPELNSGLLLALPLARVRQPKEVLFYYYKADAF